MKRDKYEAIAASMAAVTIEAMYDSLSLGVIECEEADYPLSDAQLRYLWTTAMQRCDGLAKQHRDMLAAEAWIRETLAPAWNGATALEAWLNGHEDAS